MLSYTYQQPLALSSSNLSDQLMMVLVTFYGDVLSIQVPDEVLGGPCQCTPMLISLWAIQNDL